MAYTVPGINPDQAPVPEQSAAPQGPGSDVNYQLPPNVLTPPAVQPPDMQALMAARQQALYEAQPHTGRSSPTVLNQEDYTKTGLENLEGRKDITQQQADVLQKGADQESQIQTQAAADQKLALLNDQLASQKALRDAQERDNALMTAIQSAAAEKVDPNHWWNSKTTGGKIQASIGMFLNGLGDPRLAHDQMNKAIDRDIDAQKDNISNHWHAISQQAGIGERADLRAVHDMEYRNQFRIASLEVVKQQLAAAASSTKSAMVGPNAKMAIMDINKQQDDLRKMNWDIRQKLLASQYAGQAALQKRLQEQVKEAAAHQVTLMSNPTAPMSEKEAHEAVGRMYPELVQSGYWTGAGGTGGFGTTTPTSPEQEKFEYQKQKDQAAAQKDINERTVTAPDGTKLLAADKEGGNAGRRIMDTAARFNSQLDELDKLQQLYKEGKLNMNGTARWNTIVGNLKNTYNELQDIKRASSMGERADWNDEMVPKAPWLPSANPVPQWANPFIEQSQAKLNTMREIVRKDVQATTSQMVPIGAAHSATSATDYAKFGFKPIGKPSGGVPQAIPNIMGGATGAAEPGIPSYQQFNRGR